jgi:hypothetical protein
MSKSTNQRNSSSTGAAVVGTSSQDDRPPPPATAASESTGTKKGGVTLLGGLCLYLAFPLSFASGGLLLSYLETKRNDPEKPDHQVVLERDFVLPFLMVLSFIVCLAIQTRNFSGPPQAIVRYVSFRLLVLLIR